MITHSKNDIKNEIISRLTDYINMLKKNGINNIDLNNLDEEDCLNKATDALASGNLFDCIIYDTIDQM